MILLASRTSVSLLLNCVFHGPWVNGHRSMIDTYLGTDAIMVPMTLVSCPFAFCIWDYVKDVDMEAP